MYRNMEQLAGIQSPTIDDVMAATEHIGGWMYPEELAFLFGLASKARNVVEFGVWRGRTTVALAMGCAGRVYAIDNWRGSSDELEAAHSSMKLPEGRAACFREAMANIAPFVARGKVVVVHCDHSSAAPVVEALASGDPYSPSGAAPCCLAFVDGAHDRLSVTRDILSACRLVGVGGAVAGHDITWPGVEAAVRSMFGNSWNRGPGSIWVAKVGG